MITKKDAAIITEALNEGLKQFNVELIKLNNRMDALEARFPGGIRAKCPFCGSYEIEENSDDEFGLLMCSNCGAVGPQCSSIDEARKLWNERK